MCDYKLSSEEVPKKFSEWLLAMGCPPEKVPTGDKIVEMCRGQYYMVWRSLMEHVEPKNVIRKKRLHVFCDDIYKWKRKNAFNKPDPDSVMPSELLLWHQHSDIKEKVASAEERMKKARQNLDELTEKISTKLSHRNLSRQALEDIQRRTWLLQQVADELRTKQENLQQTRAIANSLCSGDDEVHVQSKLERYLQSTRRGVSQPASTSLLVANPVASSSVVSNGDVTDNEEQLSWLLKCRGDALWPQLLERRTGLVPELIKEEQAKKEVNQVTPQSIVSHTAAMHCSLALDAMKNRALIKQTSARLATAVTELNSYLSGEACELLVVRCEVARTEARVTSLRAQLQEVTSLLSAPGCDVTGDRRATTRQIANVDKAIENKKEELKRLVSSLAATEKKIHNVRECLINIFNGFNKDVSLNENDRFRGQVEFPAESVAVLRQFYDERRERRRRKLDLSLDLDVSDIASFTEPTDPKFADELRIYLKKFNLEKNRKLVLENGEKIWIFESLSSATSRLHSSLREASLPCTVLPPAHTLPTHLRQLTEILLNIALLKNLMEDTKTGDEKKSCIGVSLKSKEEEEKMADKIKKRLNENLISLQKTNKTLELGRENIQFWADNNMRKFVSYERKVDGKSYKDFEDIFMMNLS